MCWKWISNYFCHFEADKRFGMCICLCELVHEYLQQRLPHPFPLTASIVQDLEARVKALEDGSKFNATQDAIRKREEEFLKTLEEIKATMAQEAASGGASSEEMEALKKENQALKAKLAKNEYRIRHLIEGMETMLAKQWNIFWIFYFTVW